MAFAVLSIGTVTAVTGGVPGKGQRGLSDIATHYAVGGAWVCASGRAAAGCSAWLSNTGRVFSKFGSLGSQHRNILAHTAVYFLDNAIGVLTRRNNIAGRDNI